MSKIADQIPSHVDLTTTNGQAETDADTKNTLNSSQDTQSVAAESYSGRSPDALNSDQFVSANSDPDEDDTKSVHYSKVVSDIHDKVDSYTSSLLMNLVSKIQAPYATDDLFFPAPYAADNPNEDETVTVNCFSNPKEKENVPEPLHYEIPRVDDYFGDICLLDDVSVYGRFSNGMLGNNFDETKEPSSMVEWTDSSQDNADAITCARNYFTGMIGNPLYQISDLNDLHRGVEVLKDKLLNEWGKDRRTIHLSQLWGDGPKGDDSDRWITLIAFCGYGAHRTTPKLKDDVRHENAYFINDVSFLDQYEVRPGYKKYGAAAYFGKDYRLTEIWVSHLDKTFKAPEKATSNPEWSHAKWCWKVSVSVATFLVDHLAHNQLRESSGLIKALRELPEDHELRRLMVPFTYGTVHRMRVMNEYLCECGLFHRAFAFKYKELQRLIRESMMNAPKLEKGQQRDRKDTMKYRFRLFRKKANVMRKLPEYIYPLYADTFDFWVRSLHFVKEYMEPYYGEDGRDDSKLVSEDEPEIRAFYDALLSNCGIDSKFRLKKFNVVNILAHFICGATVWNHQLHSAVSFEYSVDPDFTGLKILGNNATQNNIQNYVEYCCVAMCKGWGESDLMKIDVWKKILEKQRNSKEQQSDDEEEQTDDVIDVPVANVDILRDYFQVQMGTMETSIHFRNLTRIAPFNAMNPQYLQSSARLLPRKNVSKLLSRISTYFRIECGSDRVIPQEIAQCIAHFL